MMQEFSLKKYESKKEKAARGLSLPSITLLKAVGNLPLASPDTTTLDTSSTLPTVSQQLGDHLNLSHLNLSAAVA